MNFKDMAKQRFDELEKKEKELKEQLEEIKKEKDPLKKYLVGAGIIEVKKRGRRKKGSTEEAAS